MHLRRIALLSALAPALYAQDGDQVAQAGDRIWFEEIGLEVGVEWEHVSGRREGRYWFPEIMGGGVALFDYDGDGDLDLYLVQSGRIDPVEDEVVPTNKLFRNDLATGTTPWGFVDVTADTKVGDATYGMGAACGDYDQDGDVDLLVTNLGDNVLYKNDGRGKFKDVAKQMKVNDGRWATSAGFTDVDMDGDLDLFVVNNLNWEVAIETPCFNFRKQPDYCSPENYNAHATDALFLLGRLGYQDAAARIGMTDSPANGLGVCIADYDRDGDPDVYVANDATPNALWRNDGGKRLGKTGPGLEDVARKSGCAVNMAGTPEAGMGVQWVDLDQDGWFDLFMTHLRREKNTFYKNRGNGRFVDMSSRTGMAAAAMKFTGFGMGFHDFDLDGQLDLYVANGAVQAWGVDEAFDVDDLYAEPNHLYRGLGRVRFEHLGEGTTQPLIGTSRGAAFGDLDNDGDVDIVVVDRDARVKILRNIAPRQGSWVGLRLLNPKGADALGAQVKLTTAAVNEEDGSEQVRVQYRLAHPAYSYLSSNDPRVQFGVPTGETVRALEVLWPGKTEYVAADKPEAGVYTTVQQD